nr:phage tail tube protein [Polaromonas jejuensis]
MSSSAISAQGSTFSIGTGTGGAKAITGIAVGYPTILTIAAHGFANGDVEVIAGLTGADAALLNGLALTVKNKTTNTFAVDVDTTGKTITAGAGTATPNTYTAVKNIKTFSGFDGTASEIDTTNLDSTAKEFMLGLVDNGQFSMELDNDNADAGQLALRAKRDSGVKSIFKLVLPDASTASFSGYVKKKSMNGGVDQALKSSVDIRISGAVTWA